MNKSSLPLKNPLLLFKQTQPPLSLISKEGNPEFFDGMYVPKFDTHGKVDGLIGYFRNVTERKQAEAELRKSEASMRSVFEQANDGIYVISAENRYLDASERGLEMLGYTRDELLRMSVADALAPYEVARLAIEPPRMMSGAPHLAEWDHVRKDGSTFPGEVSARRLNDHSYLAIVRDLTERRRVENELKKYHEHLEELVKERTASLTAKTNELNENQSALMSLVEELNDTTAELAIARDRAEGADKLKSAFLATMSHELRTPLNSIIGFTGIVLQGMSGPLNEEQAKQLSMVKNSANHLLALINDVLDISKIEAGQVQIIRKSFDIRSVIEAALRTVLPLAAKKGLSLDSVIASDAGPIISDQRRVKQILINLVGNAVKFTERGAVRIECRPSEGRLEVSVRDTGIGIKAEDMGKLFTAFSQIDTGLARNHEGTGLGLSICGKLVEMLGGTIRAESEWGKGSKFIFTLPVG